ncbi:phosphoribosyl-AMP cyclohydrolase [Rhizobium sp. EC-SD404]|uniref:phosphoribosyl-AMP cyclohydrolase n=1 Tax=Rhizobium sp. EC-SD404 TaxID=2038389 RepID=UPI00125BCFBD|nr:phosphoribosyl-AMP cyclohydrolase [Rhizobium sp. EC-SD404]VVT22196.1 Phosphoribosyl-AMP cyclohydrolase [Rhizobium sp. EC-SD404]
MTTAFAAPAGKAELEEGSALTPRFSADGLVTAVVTDSRDGVLLMVAHMNAETLALTLETGIAHYYSRSRRAIWKKGESSGNLQRVTEIRVDCDQDAIWLMVDVDGHGATCHTGRRSCFYRKVETDADGNQRLVTDAAAPLFDPTMVYEK